jgi:hypothetical protein
MPRYFSVFSQERHFIIVSLSNVNVTKLQSALLDQGSVDQLNHKNDALEVKLLDYFR